MSQAKETDIDDGIYEHTHATPDLEQLDRDLAVHVMRWEHDTETNEGLWTPPKDRKPEARDPRDPPRFSRSRDLAAEVVEEIERRGKWIQSAYIEALINIVFDSERDGGILFLDDWFKIAAATPEQRCRAALKAVMTNG